MRYLVLIAMLFCSTTAYSVTLTQEQFMNLSLIDKQLREDFGDYKGMYGCKNEMKVKGIDDEVAQTAIDAMNIENLKKKDPKRKEKKKLRKKFKSMGLDDEDLALLGLTNDIPDGGV